MTWTCLTDSHSSNISSFYQTDSVKYQLGALDKLPPRPFGFYAITRFNPLFTEETDTRIEKTYNCTRTDTIKYEGKRDRSEYYLHTRALCEDSYTVLERNSDLISRVLVSVRIGGPYRKQISSSGLAPIPEGKIDLIPCPIWPQDKNEGFDKEGEDIAVETNAQANFRHDVTEPAQTRGVRKSETLYVGRKSSLCKMLREISEGSSINVTMTSVETAADLSAKIVLQSLLRGKMDEYVEDSSHTPTVPRHFGQCKSTNVFGGDQAAMFHRALRLVEKYYERSPNVVEKRKYQSFQGSGMFTHSSSNSCYEPTQGSSSSSSSVATRISTTGLSDLTQTPISSDSSSSSSEFPTTSPIILKNNNITRALRNERTCRNDVVELYDEPFVGKNASCNDASSDVKKSVSFNTFQCRIVPINRTGYSTQSASSAQFKHTEITNFIDDFNIKSKSQLSSFPGRRCPDFTLDVHQAEKVSKEIKYKEKERCWCRILTSCAGFVLLLFAVMFFSMMLTRGERIFGSL